MKNDQTVCSKSGRFLLYKRMIRFHVRIGLSFTSKKMKTYYYSKPTDDVIASVHQNFHVPDDYQILVTSLRGRIWNYFVRTLAAGFGWIYSRLFLHVKVVGKEKLKSMQDGYFVYGNHTQPLGDVFTPLTIFSPYRFYAIADQANWGIPIIGKYLVRYGGLPVGNNLHQSIQLVKAIKIVIQKQKGIILIYPEAHVWPYYPKIRPFPATSFHFPVALHKASFTITTTYQHSSFHVKPKITVYVDGPFYPDSSLGKKEAQLKLHQQILAQLTQRARLSNYSYYHYQPKK